MEEKTPNPDEVIQQLKLQNFELAQRLQFWRLENNRLMNEKHVVMKENNDLAIENNVSLFTKLFQVTYSYSAYF